MGWLISAASSAVAGHVSNRSGSWWTGENSIWGRLTGGGSDREGAPNVTVQTDRGEKVNPLIYVAAAYFLLR